LPNSCRITNLFFSCLLQPLFPLFRCSHTGNRRHEDVARFGYRPGRTIIFFDYAAFWRPIGVGAINLANLVQKPCFLGDNFFKKRSIMTEYSHFIYIFHIYAEFLQSYGEKFEFLPKTYFFPFLVTTLPKFTK
jgi:hypothetical protein